MPDSDAAIVQRTLVDDKNEYAHLVRRYQSAVLAQTLTVTGRAEEAESLAQTAFVKAYLALPGLNRPESFAAWLFGITRNVCYDWLRRRQREPVTASIDETENGDGKAEPADPAEALERRETHRRILEAVTMLPTEYAVTVSLKHQGGMTCREIAEALGVPLGTVTSRLARAHQMLRDRLAAHV